MKNLVFIKKIWEAFLVLVLVSGVSFSPILTTVVSATGSNPRIIFIRAHEAFKAERYKEARRLFWKFIRDFPENDFTDNAYFWIGESFLKEHRYKRAIGVYDELLKRYPDSDKAPSALLKKSLAFHKLNDEKRAKRVLKKLIRRYPGSNQARIARRILIEKAPDIPPEIVILPREFKRRPSLTEPDSDQIEKYPEQHKELLSKGLPELVFSVNIYDANNDKVFDGGEKVKIQVNVKNNGTGEAKGVYVLLEGNKFLLDLLGTKKELGSIPPASEKEAIFTTYLPNEIGYDTAKLSIKVKEARGYSPAEIKTFTIAMKPSEIRETEQIISKLSDVDIIPAKIEGFKRENSYAVVIGISNYRDKFIPEVKYAKSDAEIVAKYLENVGGIPRKNIKILTDNHGTLSDLISYIEEWLPRRVKKDSEVFIYYAGHGTPDPETREAYIVPYDGHPDFKSKLYPLSRMYASLNKLPSEQIVVMLDSCFSGSGGRSVMPKGARPIALSIENPVLAGGKIAVLAASTGTQISSDYEKVKHGLFTYYLLKGMKGYADSDKDEKIELGELYRYIKENVTEVASVELNRDQTPVLLPDIEQNTHKDIEITRVQ
jgi:tol-pal system protein YbgF